MSQCMLQTQILWHNRFQPLKKEQNKNRTEKKENDHLLHNTCSLKLILDQYQGRIMQYFSLRLMRTNWLNAISVKTAKTWLMASD